MYTPSEMCGPRSCCLLCWRANLGLGIFAALTSALLVYAFAHATCAAVGALWTILPMNMACCGLQAWVSETHVVVGSKCNKLLCVDASTLQMQDIAMPPKPARSQELSIANSNHPGCGIHAMALSPDGSMLAVSGSDPSDCQIMQIEHRHGRSPVFSPMQTLVVRLTVQLCIKHHI